MVAERQAVIGRKEDQRIRRRLCDPADNLINQRDLTIVVPEGRQVVRRPQQQREIQTPAALRLHLIIVLDCSRRQALPGHGFNRAVVIHR